MLRSCLCSPLLIIVFITSWEILPDNLIHGPFDAFLVKSHQLF
jgi:hypothetical protein